MSWFQQSVEILWIFAMIPEIRNVCFLFIVQDYIFLKKQQQQYIRYQKIKPQQTCTGKPKAISSVKETPGGFYKL